MSHSADYILELFEDRERGKLHNSFKISTHNDQIRGEIYYAYKNIIDHSDFDLDEIKFVAEDLEYKSYNSLIREIFCEKERILKIEDLETKANIINMGPDEDYSGRISPYFVDVYNRVKLNSDNNLAVAIDQLDLLIAELKKDWIKSNSRFEDDIVKSLNIDFEKKSNLNYGYTQSELALFDILAFVRYAFNYITTNKNAEFYYTRLVDKYAYPSQDIYNMVEEFLK